MGRANLREGRITTEVDLEEKEQGGDGREGETVTSESNQALEGERKKHTGLASMLRTTRVCGAAHRHPVLYMCVRNLHKTTKFCLRLYVVKDVRSSILLSAPGSDSLTSQRTAMCLSEKVAHWFRAGRQAGRSELSYSQGPGLRCRLCSQTNMGFASRLWWCSDSSSVKYK